MNGKNCKLEEQYERERLGWNLYYDTLSAIEEALKKDDSFALELHKKARRIVEKCFVRFGAE